MSTVVTLRTRGARGGRRTDGGAQAHRVLVLQSPSRRGQRRERFRQVADRPRAAHGNDRVAASACPRRRLDDVGRRRRRERLRLRERRSSSLPRARVNVFLVFVLPARVRTVLLGFGAGPLPAGAACFLGRTLPGSLWPHFFTFVALFLRARAFFLPAHAQWAGNSPCAQLSSNDPLPARESVALARLFGGQRRLGTV